MNSAFGPVMQHGYVVEDVAKTATEWAERVGVGPFYVLDRVVMEDYAYRGQRMTIELRIAFSYWGSVQIELAQPLSTGDSLYNHALRDAPGQLNHCAALVSDLDGLLARRGLRDRIIQSGGMGEVKFVYLGGYLPGGLHLELIQGPESMRMGNAGMEAAARAWDGARPLRPMEALPADLAALRPGG
jgi:hypothetical protein